MNSTARDLLDRTLAAASKDTETVKEGALIVPLLDGMSIKETATIVDERGSLTEMFDPRWNWHPEPLTYCYTVTIRPGIVKGWALHKTHEDRYFVVDGEMEVVLFDPRPESSTYGHICKLQLTGERPRIVNIPRFVWHADYNFGHRDVRLMNFPTIPYDHRNPDKYRLPIDTPLIPYSFGDAKGW
jgi:dTDP-4-dehydrorhamnose 3,5-epimerase